VYTLDLQNCDMILGIQWLAKLKTIVCNYEEMWMAFIWQGQEVCIKGDKPVTVETVAPGHRGDPKNNLDYGKKKNSGILLF